MGHALALDVLGAADSVAIADAVPGIVFRTSRAGDCDYCNRFWCDYTGLTVSETMGTGWLQAIHPDDRQRVVRWWRDPASHGADVQHRIRAADGGYRWFLVRARPVHDAGTLVHWVGVAIDIDATRHAEIDRRDQVERDRHSVDRIRRLHRMTALLVEAITPKDVAAIALTQALDATGAFAGTVTRLVDDGTILELIDMTGYPDEVRQRWRRPVDGDGPHCLAVRTCAPVWLESRLAIGARFPALAVGSTGIQAMVIVPLVRAGRAVGTFGLSYHEPQPAEPLDRIRLTEQAQATERERSARIDAEQQVRQREQFLSIASHELRTPVTAVQGFVQLLEREIAREPFDAGRVLRHLAAIQAGTNRLTALTNDLLDVSRLRFGQLELHRQPFSLTALTRRIVTEYRDGLDERFSLSLSIDTDVIVNGDASRVDQVISNLLSNAVKYSPDGGEIAVLIMRQPDAVDVIVDDHGIGVPFDSLEAIFAPFGRADNANNGHFPGWGLGLSICREIAELHGGRIWAEINAAGGLRVALRLPLDVRL